MSGAESGLEVPESKIDKNVEYDKVCDKQRWSYTASTQARDKIDRLVLNIFVERRSWLVGLWSNDAGYHEKYSWTNDKISFGTKT